MALQAPSTEDPGWFSVEQVDVDLIPELTMRYDELVPVLLGRREGQPAIQLCHYFLDRMKVQNFLKSVYDFTART